MAQFNGAGALTLGGTDGRVYDIDFENTGGLVFSSFRGHIEACDFSGQEDALTLSGDETTVHACTFTSIDQYGILSTADSPAISDCTVYIQNPGVVGAGIRVDGNRSKVEGNRVIASGANVGAAIEAFSNHQIIQGNTIEIDGCRGITATGDGGLIEGNTIEGQATAGSDGIWVSTGLSEALIANNVIYTPDAGIVFEGSFTSHVVVTGNTIAYAERHGIDLSAVTTGTGLRINNNHILDPGRATANTYDGIIIDGDGNTAIGNSVVTSSGQARYGINVAGGNDNIVHANDLGLSSAYGTADSVDNGTGTQTTPTAGAIGGQFAH